MVRAIYAVRHSPVIRKEDQTLRVLVKPPNREKALVPCVPKRVNDIAFDARVGGAGDSARFPELDVHVIFFCGLAVSIEHGVKLLSIKGDVVTRFHTVSRVGNSSIDAYPAGGNYPIGLAPREPSREGFVDAHAGLRGRAQRHNRRHVGDDEEVESAAHHPTTREIVPQFSSCPQHTARVMVCVCGNERAKSTLIARSNTMFLLLAAAASSSAVAPACSQPDLFLAVGVVSAPEFVFRRTVARTTWMRLAPSTPNAGGADQSHALPWCVQFVVRALHAPGRIQRQLAMEQREHGDILEVDVPWNETRMRGPVLTLAAWTRYAATNLTTAKYVVKVDDDSYLHVPGLARTLSLQVDTVGLPTPMAYIGTLTWYSWFAKQFDRCGFGWSWRGSNVVGKMCRNATWAAARCNGGCGEAVGPFPFAAGYLIILTQPLAAAIASSPALPDEVRRLTLAQALWTHKGFKHTQIFEDVWLGSFVHRFIVPRPLTFVQLFKSEIVCDLDQYHWSSTVLPSALLVHIRSKEPRVFLAVHDLLNSSQSQHCRDLPQRKLSCYSGCDAFGIPHSASAARTCMQQLPTSSSTSGAGGSARSLSSFCTLRPRTKSAQLSACKPQNLKPAVKSHGAFSREKKMKGLVHGLTASPLNGRALAQRANAINGRSGLGGGRGWHSHGLQLQAMLHVAHLKEDGTLMVPDSAKVVLEVGANTRNTLDRELLPADPTAFLISFEPLLDKYAALLARNSRVDTLTPLGHHHPRGIVLPFAVASEANALRELKISGTTDGCASLLSPVSSYYSPLCTNLSGIRERRTVPTVSLHKVLSSWLKGHTVQLAKIDAQGLDVGVVRSAGDAVSRVKAIQMEVVRDRPPLKCEPQYASEEGRASEAKCGVLVAAMAEMGFTPYGTNCAVHKFKEAGGCEAEMTFVRDGFDAAFVRKYCMAQKPHSCGPGAWSLPSQRKSWNETMHAWASEEAKKWPSIDLEPSHGTHASVRTRPLRLKRSGRGQR